MKLKNLEAYRAVMSTGSTQAAAALLGISQSAISRRISQLEEELGLELFYRDGVRLVPSRANKMAEPLVADVLERLHTLREAAQHIRLGQHASAMLRIAVPPGISRRIMPAIIADFLKECPDIRLEVLHGTYDVIQRMLEEKQAEIAFLRLPYASTILTRSDVIETKSVCVIQRGHRLSELSVIRPSDLKGEPLVLLGWRRAPRHDLDLVFSAHGIAPTIRIEAHSVASACGFSAQGIGISIVNALLVQDCTDLEIDIRPFEPAVPHQFAFVYTDQPRLPPIGLEFIRHATAALKKLSATALPRRNGHSF